MKFFTSGSCKVKSSYAEMLSSSNLVEPSSRAGLNDSPVDGVVLKLNSIFTLGLILTPAGHHCSQEEQGTYQPPHGLHFWKIFEFVDNFSYIAGVWCYKFLFSDQNILHNAHIIVFGDVWFLQAWNLIDDIVEPPLSIQFSAVQLNTAISFMFQHLHDSEWKLLLFEFAFCFSFSFKPTLVWG